MEERFLIAKKIIKEVGEFLKSERKGENVLKNLRFDIKIKQDIESENLILKRIEERFPYDGWVSEEKGKKESSSGFLWIIDPLDGTVNYSKGIPHCSISIGCRYKGEKAFGFVYDFLKEELFWAKRGKGAFLNGKRIKVSRVRNLEDAIIGFGLMKGKEEIKKGMEILSLLTEKVKKIRMMGSASLDLCYVGCGRIDGFVELGLNEWDVEAGSLIVEEAGGRFKMEDFEGISKVVATNQFLIEKL